MINHWSIWAIPQGLPNLDVQLDAQPFARGEVGDSNEPHGAFPGLTRRVDAQFTWWILWVIDVDREYKYSYRMVFRNQLIPKETQLALSKSTIRGLSYIYVYMYVYHL